MESYEHMNIMKDVCYINNHHQKHVFSVENNVDCIKRNLVAYDFGFSVSMLKIMASPTKLKVIFALTQKNELSVGEMATIIGTSSGTASHHLSILRKLGLVTLRKERKESLYSIKSEQINSLVLSIVDLGRTI